MADTRSRRRLKRRIGRLFALLVVATGATVAMPRLARRLARLDMFRVTELKLENAQYLTLPEAAAAANVPEEASVWDDPAEWLARLEKHPLVQSARVRRRIPGTLVFEVEERQPVALVPTPTLQAVDVEGKILPLDPSAHGLDLPLLHVNSKARDAEKVRAALASEAEWLVRLDPEFAGKVSELARDERGDLIATWGNQAVLFRFTPDVTARQIQEGMLVLDYVMMESGESPATVDLRFEEQVVVRKPE